MSIILDNISKKFVLTSPRLTFVGQLKNKLLSKTPSLLPIEVWPNQKITLTINPGQVIGLIGSNGAGKSTLLRIIAGIYLPTAGRVEVTGKIISLINLKRGLREKLNMIDNIFFLGCLFGLTRKEIKNRLNDIIKDSDLATFKEIMVRNFSEGMKERLILSIALHSDFDILLLDEALASLDDAFIDRQMANLLKIKGHQKIIVMVSHNLEMVRKYCQRIILLERGQIKMTDRTEMIEAYVRDRR